MPSDNMKRYPVDLYNEQDAQIKKILRSSKVKRARFLRECIKYVISNDSRLKTVLNKSKLKNYTMRKK